jgi:hypothetical protein
MTNKYTNVILTVIAAALVTIAVQNLTGPVNAQAGVQRVVICSANDTKVCATVGARNPGLSSYVGFLAVSDGIK